MKTIVIEGINGAGKSELGRRVEIAVGSLGRPCRFADAAAFGEIGRAVRPKLVEPTLLSNADLDATLFTALRAEGALHLMEAFREHSDAIIVIERWELALAAYGAVDRVTGSLVQQLVAFLSRTLRIELTVLLDAAGAVAARRLPMRETERNRFEARGSAYLDTVANSYRELVRERNNTFMIDANREADAVFATAWPAIHDRVLSTLT